MAGHSKFKNIMHRKGAQDARKAKTFNKIARDMTVAVKHGSPDPGMNPRLRAAIIKARSVSMPNDRIERAIKAGSDNDTTNYEEVRYEGFGPGGVAVIVEALTDNRNRAAAELRTIFSKNGGAMGEGGSVGFMFDRVGEIAYPPETVNGKVRTRLDADAVFEAAVEAGADNAESDDEGHYITTSPDALAEVRDALEARFGAADSAKLVWQPNVTATPPAFENAQTLMKLIEALEDNDDVQDVTTNADIPEEWAERLG